MTGDKDHKQANQQIAAFHLTGQKHKRERHKRHNPGIDSQHDTDLSGLHMEALRDVRKQANGNKFSGIEDKGSHSQRNYP